MIRVRALNESSNDVRTGTDKIKSRETKEAQEVQAYDLYNTALLLLKNKCFDQASEKFNQILKTSLVMEAASTLVDEEGEALEKPLKNPGLVLKYSSHKNLAAMESEQGNLTAAMEHYLEAVKLDTTDVTLWLTIGTHAVSLGRFYLAKHAFNCGLQCNQLHWPCMDHLITVLFILYDFEGCLMWIAKALEREPGYTKAIVFRDQIFNLCPHLQRDTYHLFRLCSSAIYDVQVDDEVAAQYLQKAEDLRERHRQACLPAPLDDVTLNRLLSLDWHSVGSSLLTAYQQIMTSSSSNMGFHSKVKMGNLPYCRAVLNAMKMKRKDKNFAGEVRELTTPVSEYMSEESVDSLLSLSDSKSPRAAKKTTTATTGENPQPQKGVTFNFDVVCDVGDVEMMTCDDDEDGTMTSSEVVKRVMDEMLAAIEENEEEFSIKADVRRTMNELVGKVEKSVAVSRISTTREVDDGKKKRKRKGGSGINPLEDFKKRRSTRNRTSKKPGEFVAPPFPAKIRKLKVTQVDEAPSKSPQSKQSYIDLIKEVIPDSMVKLYEISTYKQSYEKSKDTKTDDKTSKKERKKDTDSATSEMTKCTKYDDIQEAEDVLKFIEAYQDKTIVDWLQQYCRVFVDMMNVRWRKGIKELLVKISDIILPHVTYPGPDDLTESDYKSMKGVLLKILTCIECQVDLVTPTGRGNHNLISNQLEYLSSMVPKHEIFQHDKLDDDATEWEQFVLRVQWCKYKFACLLNQNDEAMVLLSSCSVIIGAMETRRKTTVIVSLPNHSTYQCISNNVMVTKMQEYERSQLLDDVNGYFDKGQYTNVVSLLLPTLIYEEDDSTNAVSPSSKHHPARAKQLRHLMIAQWKVGDRKESLSAMSRIINEICNRLMKRSSDKGNVSKELMTQQKLKDWKSTLNVLLKYLDEYLTSFSMTTSKPFQDLTEKDLSNLTYGLVNIVDYMLNYGTHITIDPSMLITSLCILYRFANSMLDDTEEDEVIFRANLLSSMHDWAGEKRLCCARDGHLLRLITTELSIPSKDSFGLVYDVNMDGAVQDCLEQTFFCIFTYPAKTKGNKFDDHLTRSMPSLCCRLKKPTWLDYVSMFNYSKQPDLPQFDSMKLLTISSDFAQQIQKALLLLPSQLQAQVRMNEDRVNLFLDSQCTASPMTSLPDYVHASDEMTSDARKKELAVVGCMYYLFADFKFKRNELPTAIKFYMHDLALTPNRFDSWAGIALSKSGLTENTLRSCNKTSVVDTERRAQMAVACFEQALSIDGVNVKLWIEFGSFAYWLQAMYSRRIARIKRTPWGRGEEEEDMDQDDLGRLPPATASTADAQKRQRKIDSLERKKRKMQRLSRHCFEMVEKCDDSDEVKDEEWLIEYMLGKHDEKEGKPPSVTLRRYQQAAIKLHNRGAKYPKKIQTRYTQGTNELSGEALEMYYRLHASALSYISKYSPIVLNQQHGNNDDDIVDLEKLPRNFLHEVEYIKEVLDEATRCPFVQRTELKTTTSTAIASSSVTNSQEDKNNQSKLSGGVKESKDFSMGSLVPDSIQQALNYHVDAIRGTDDDSQNSPLRDSPALLGSATPTPSSGTQSRDAPATSGPHIPPPLADMAKRWEEASEEATAAAAAAADATGVQHKQQRQAVISKSKLTESVVMVIDLCEKAFRLCLRRYPQHYKAVYRLSSIYMTWSHKLNLKWARDLLYGSASTPWQQLDHMPSPGLMAERNKTNLFNGVWRISDDDVDRPGSFSNHLERCVGLLLYVLRHLHDSKTLLHIHNLLNRIPDPGRQYLKDGDRMRLARRAVVYSRSIVRCRLRHLTSVTPIVTSHTSSSITYRPLARDFYLADEDFTAGSLVAAASHHCSIDVISAQQRRKEVCTGAAAATSHHQQGISNSVKSLRQESGSIQMEDTSKQQTSSSSDQELLSTLMEAYKIYQDTNKHPQTTVRVDTSRDRDDCTHQRLLAEAYHKYTCVIKENNREDDTKENELAPRIVEEMSDSQVISLVEKALKFCHQKHRQMYSNKSSSATDNVTASTTTTSNTPQATAATINNNNNSSTTSTTPVASSIKRPLLKPPQVVLTSITGSKTPSTTTTSASAGSDVTSGKDESLVNYTNKLGPCTDNKKPPTEVVLSEGMSGKVTMVKKDGQTYTKIQPKPIIGGKRNNIGFVHLQIPQQDMDSRTELRRSSSVPLADEGSLHIRHRALFRTGSSVSDSTKLILRSTIQQGRSAALIRKPSITDHEIQQIDNDDENDDDDDDDDDDMSGWSDDCDDDQVSSCKKMKMGSDVATSSSVDVKDKPDVVVAPMSPLQVTMTTAAT